MCVIVLDLLVIIFKKLKNKIYRHKYVGRLMKETCIQKIIEDNIYNYYIFDRLWKDTRTFIGKVEYM